MKDSKIKVNYVDFILAGLLIIILASLISMFFSKSVIVDISSKETITVTLKIENIKNEHHGLIRQNEDVYLGDSDISFGKIKSVKYFMEPEIVVSHDDSNHPFLIRNIHPDSVNNLKLVAIIDVECEGRLNGKVLETVNHNFSIGDILDFCVYNYSAKASIIDFYEV